jgi:hypothetical protein
VRTTDNWLIKAKAVRNSDDAAGKVLAERKRLFKEALEYSADSKFALIYVPGEKEKSIPAPAEFKDFILCDETSRIWPRLVQARWIAARVVDKTFPMTALMPDAQAAQKLLDVEFKEYSKPVIEKLKITIERSISFVEFLHKIFFYAEPRAPIYKPSLLREVRIDSKDDIFRFSILPEYDVRNRRYISTVRIALKPRSFKPAELIYPNEEFFRSYRLRDNEQELHVGFSVDVVRHDPAKNEFLLTEDRAEKRKAVLLFRTDDGTWKTREAPGDLTRFKTRAEMTYGDPPSIVIDGKKFDF